MEPIRRPQGTGADYHSFYAPCQRGFDIVVAPQSAPKLARYSARFDDCANAVAINRLSSFCSIQIYEMQPLSALFNPPVSGCRRIVAENGFLGIVALPQPHTFSAAQVNGGKDQHGVFLSLHASARRVSEDSQAHLELVYASVANL